MDTHTIVSELDRIDLDLVHRWLSADTYWAAGRSRETVEAAARASLNFAALDAEGVQVGYARVVTDHATFAWVCDVYVARTARGRGLGLALAEAITGTLRPMRLGRVLLSTLDAHDLYRRVGFEPLTEPQRLMILAAEA